MRSSPPKPIMSLHRKWNRPVEVHRSALMVALLATEAQPVVVRRFFVFYVNIPVCALSLCVGDCPPNCSIRGLASWFNRLGGACCEMVGDMAEDVNTLRRTASDGIDGGIALQLFRTPAVGGLEGIEAGTHADLSCNRINESISALDQAFARTRERTGDPRLLARQQTVLDAGRRALSKLSNDGDAAVLDRDEITGLEAVVIADGTRPSLFVQDDRVDPTVPQAASWVSLITDFRTGIITAARSVGRIIRQTAPASPIGTGFVVGPGLIATARHVLQALADQDGSGKWVLRRPDTAIDFAGEYKRARQTSYRVTGVAFAGPEYIPEKGDIRTELLDLALLTVDPESGPESFPAPLPLLADMKPLRAGSEIYVIGFPAQPRAGLEPYTVLQTVFQDEYNVKRFAPGYALQHPDDIGASGADRVFTHDASTLAGNSGSCVVEFRREGKAGVGLHFGGYRRDQNFAHSLARLSKELSAHGVILT